MRHAVLDSLEQAPDPAAVFRRSQKSGSTAQQPVLEAQRLCTGFVFWEGKHMKITFSLPILALLLGGCTINPDSSEISQETNSGAQAPQPQKPRNLVIFFIIGAMLACVLAQFVAFSGLFRSWEKIPPPPVKAKKLLGTESFWSGMGRLFILAEDDQVYAYALPGIWAAVSDEISIESAACDITGIKFMAWKRPFSVSFECARIYGHGDIAPAPMFLYVLDQDGMLWYWYQDYMWIWPPVQIVFLIASALLGLLAFLCWMVFLRLRINARHEQNTQAGLNLRAWEVRSSQRTARGLSLASVCVLFLYNISGIDLGRMNLLFHLVTALIAILGLIIAWRWPNPGGIMAILIYTVRVVMLLIPKPRDIVYMAYFDTTGLDIVIDTIFIFLPGLLFLGHRYLSLKLEEETNTELWQRRPSLAMAGAEGVSYIIKEYDSPNPIMRKRRHHRPRLLIIMSSSRSFSRNLQLRSWKRHPLPEVKLK
jgi:hypothetical protein